MRDFQAFVCNPQKSRSSAARKPVRSGGNALQSKDFPDYTGIIAK